MRCLITGGAGFIGSHVADSLIEAGHQVLIVDNLQGGYKENIPLKARWHKVDIRDYQAMRSVFAIFNPEIVYHLAAYASEGLSSNIKKFNYETNLLGSINLLNLSVLYNVRRFIFTSSIAVYGRGRRPGYLFEESDIPAPEDSYGISKYAIEMELQNSYQRHGLEYTIFRPHNVYGERQNIWDPYRNVVGIFILKAMNKEPLPIFGEGNQQRQFTYIKDISGIIANGYKGFPNQVYNLGVDLTYSVLELANQVSKTFNLTDNIKLFPARNEVIVALEAHKILPLVSQTPLEIGIDLMASWALTRVNKKSPFKPPIEIQKGLPEAWR